MIEEVVFSFIGESMVSSLSFCTQWSLLVVAGSLRETPYRSVYIRSHYALMEPLF